MNSVIEKEKKLNLALAKLKNLNLKNPEIKKDLEDLSAQKNQLEIEKRDLEEKYKTLKGVDIEGQFIDILQRYIEETYK